MACHAFIIEIREMESSRGFFQRQIQGRKYCEGIKTDTQVSIESEYKERVREQQTVIDI